MPMSKETTRELADLAHQLEAQLKFYRDLGVTDIGGAAVQAQLAFDARPGAPADVPAATESRSLYQDDTRTTSQVADGRVPMREEKETHSSLFGDLAGGKTTGSRTPSLATPGARDSSLEAIRQDMGDCVRCKLHLARTNIVFGEGNPEAKLVFVGEGPGADEDASGRPFVGKAGQLLNKIIEAIGLKREDVYICNVVKCRPPGNRTPEPDEVATCQPFLFRQLAFIRPNVIVTLGLPAFQCLLRSKESMSRSRGVWREWNGIKVMPTFHPAYLLRSPDKKREAWDDMKKVRDFLGSLGD